MSETHTKTAQGVLVDEVRESPVDKYLLRFRRRVVWALLLIVLALAAGYYFFCRTEDRPASGEPSSSGYSAIDPAPARTSIES